MFDKICCILNNCCLCVNLYKTSEIIAPITSKVKVLYDCFIERIKKCEGSSHSTLSDIESHVHNNSDIECDFVIENRDDSENSSISIKIADVEESSEIWDVKIE